MTRSSLVIYRVESTYVYGDTKVLESPFGFG